MAVQKTTVYLDAEDYRKIKAIAKAERRAPADLVREAIAEYAGKHVRRAQPRSIGIGRPMSDDGRFLLCNQHGALYRVQDGACVLGACADDSLATVAVTEDGDDLVFGV